MRLTIHFAKSRGTAGVSLLRVNVQVVCHLRRCLSLFPIRRQRERGAEFASELLNTHRGKPAASEFAFVLPRPLSRVHSFERIEIKIEALNPIRARRIASSWIGISDFQAAIIRVFSLASSFSLGEKRGGGMSLFFQASLYRRMIASQHLGARPASTRAR